MQSSTSGLLPLHAGYRSILVLTSLAYTRAGQSERRIPPAPISTPTWSSRLSGQWRILLKQTRGTPENEHHLVISLRRLHFPNTFSCLIYPSLAIEPFRFGGIETWLGDVRRASQFPTTSSNDHTTALCALKISTRHLVLCNACLCWVCLPQKGVK